MSRFITFGEMSARGLRLSSLSYSVAIDKDVNTNLNLPDEARQLIIETVALCLNQSNIPYYYDKELFRKK